MLLLNWRDLSLKNISNPSLQEAQSLLRGEIVLSQRIHDTALYDEQVFNVFQPGQTFFFLIHYAAAGDMALAFFQVEIFLLFVFSVFFIGVALFRLSNGQNILTVSLTASIMFGAPYIANLPRALFGSVSRVNHCLATLCVAVLLFLVSNHTFHRRLLLISACIGGAMLFRAQNVLLLFLPVSQLLQDASGNSWQLYEAFSTHSKRKILAGRIAKLLVFPLLATLIIMGFQMAKFNNPLETGYAFLYEGRDDFLAQRASDYGLYALRFLGENLYQTLFAFPRFEFNGWRITKILGDPNGNSLLFSQPILIIGLFIVGSLTNARAQSFLFMALLITAPVLLYHNPGLYAPGYMRLSLDYCFLWIAAIAVCAGYVKKPRIISCASVILAIWAVVYGIALLVVEVST